MEESEWKARQVLRMLHKHRFAPRTVAEAGCGAGEVLRQLQLAMDSTCQFSGYDISPQAIEMCRGRANARLHFHLADLTEVPGAHFDLVLVLDVIEHLEDYYTFMRALKQKARYVIFHLPLELSVQTILRSRGLLQTQQSYGHLHYFTKETGLAAVRNAGYNVVDYFYTARALEEPTHELPRRLLMLPRRALFTVNKNLASRVLGGFSLLMLARGLR